MDGPVEPEQRDVPLVAPDGSAVEILWWGRDDAPVPSFAASELRQYLEEMSGISVATSQATADVTPDAVPSAVILVPTDEAESLRTTDDRRPRLREEWLAAAAEALDGAEGDAFAGVTVSDVVVLAGATHRGTLYGAYELLERLGVRFFAPDYEFYERTAERCPSRTTIVVDPPDYVEEPSLTYRRKDIAEGRSHTARTVTRMVDWMAKVRLNVLATPADFTNLELGTVTWDTWRDEVVPELEKRGIRLEAGGHGFDAFLPRDGYGDEHPEWFVDGYNVFDVTEEDAVEAYVEQVVEYLADRPEIDIFDAWPPDGAEWPPVVAEEFGSVANAYAHVVDRVREAVAESLPRRDVEIEAIAYTSHIRPPDPEYMYDEDVIVDFAPFDRSYAEPIFESDDGMNRTYVELMREWREAFDGTLATYEYYRKYSWHSLPVVLPSLIGREIPFYGTVGLDGLWLYSEPADWIPYELVHLLVAKLSWDTSVDAEAYVDRYLAERYGPAADDVGRYVDCVEHAGMALFDKFRGRYDDPDAVSTAREAYRRAEDALVAAERRAPAGSPASFVVDRLRLNLEFALADIDIDYHRHEGREEAATEAKRRTKELLDDHYLDGVVLRSNWALGRCVDEEAIPPAGQFIAEYQSEWTG